MSDLHFIPKNLSTTVQKTRASELMELMLLNQYNTSPNLKAYFNAFFYELDTLFEASESVYLGRFLEYARGVNLDVIGRILGQSRYISIPVGTFGFAGAVDSTGAPALGFGNETDPSVGGVFRGIDSLGFNLVPLTDPVYKRVLDGVAESLVSPDASINNAYRIVSKILGFIPETFHFNVVGAREVELTLGADSGTDFNIDLLNYMSKYFVPLGTIFSITVI